jgi:SAM-dependent methyltransferase
MSLERRRRAAAKVLTDARDVLAGRPDGALPQALVDRGWSTFLASLSDARLDALEARGVDGDWRGAPPDLLAMLEAIREVCAMPSLAAAAEPGERPSRRRETPRKRAQVDGFAELIVPLAAGAARVVDVGSGHGHLTRTLAERIARPVIGLERDAVLARTARGLPSSGALLFAVTDVLRDGLPLRPGDCVVGLHACGELGDAMVEAVRGVAGPVSIALIGCCLQKRRETSRRPLVGGGAGDAPELARGLLGLSNLTTGDQGVEATRAENLAARERRLALHKLLSVRSPALPAGAEIAGLNRRAAHGELRALADRAFRRRGWETPSAETIDEAGTWARGEHARSRRLSLPRSMLARVLEVFVLLDRAAHLEGQGFRVSVGAAFAPGVSARNLALVGRR